MSKTIYFSGAITGGRDDVPLYRRFVSALEEAGHRVLAGAVTSEGVTSAGEPVDPRAVFQRDLDWIDQADIVVAEVSTPSHGVGYEIATARYRFGTPVICLWRPSRTRRCSAMLSGDAGIRFIEYTDQTVGEAADRLLVAIAEIRR